MAPARQFYKFVKRKGLWDDVEDPIGFSSAVQSFKEERDLKRFSPSTMRYSLYQHKLAVFVSHAEGEAFMFLKPGEAASDFRSRSLNPSAHLAAIRRVAARREQTSTGNSTKLQVDLSIDDNESIDVGETGSWSFHMTNVSDAELWVLVSVHGRSDGLSMRPANMLSEVETCLQPGSPHQVVLSIRASGVGVYRSKLVFTFWHEGDSESQSTSEYISLKCGDADLIQRLRPSAPFAAPNRRMADGPGNYFIPGVPLPSPPGVPALENPIPYPKKFDLSSRVVQYLHQSLEVMGQLSFSNYVNFFTHLLKLEEAQMLEDIKAFDIHADQNVTLQPSYPHFRLQVPGLAENRPSVLVGDSLMARPAGGRTWYQGYAHRVEQETVVLKFADQFHSRYIKSMAVDIRFSFNRMALRLQHQGLDHFGSLSKQVVFPDAIEPLQPELPRAASFRSSQQLNKEQNDAVQHILKMQARPQPYVVFGPPGTGKTTTIVEAIRQCTQADGCRILVCAPSNDATDVLVERLAKKGLTSFEMLRILAYSRNPSDSPDAVQPHIQKSVVLEQVTSFKVVATTLTTAAKLYNIGVPINHFNMIFIDEAGQAPEPEVTSVIATLLDTSARAQENGGQVAQLVISGDPRQLGPIVHSDVCKKSGLGVSFLERIMALPAYQRDVGLHPHSHGHDPHRITKLVKNYRSHPAIFKVPNDLFYNGDLEEAADRAMTSRFLNWEHLPQKGHPVIFHSVSGTDEREGNSPSWFNTMEIIQVVEYVRLLKCETRPAVSLEDIAIISPYNKQVQKIRQILRHGSRRLPRLGDEVTVGTCERLQGQERKVVIISTVRSNEEHLQFDMNHFLGFVSNPNRFNVAITRAKALLIVVGNPKILGRDPSWAAFLSSCAQVGAWRGEGIAEAMDPPAYATATATAEENGGSSVPSESDQADPISHGLQQGGVEWRRPE